MELTRKLLSNYTRISQRDASRDAQFDDSLHESIKDSVFEIERNLHCKKITVWYDIEAYTRSLSRSIIPWLA